MDKIKQQLKELHKEEKDLNNQLDIKRANLMIASKSLMHTAQRKANANGFTDFRPEDIDVDKEWIDKTLDRYRSFQAEYV